MISLSDLQEVIAESQSLGNIVPVSRNSYQSWLADSVKTKLIKAIVGFRRSGKSFLLKMFTQELQQKLIPPSNIFYLNFENDFLSQIKSVSQLRQIWELYLREIAVGNSPIFIIWDEIQLVSGWEKLVRALYEQGKYNIYISGSNSHLLSGELSSSLSGRCLTLEIFPFNFSEFLDFRQITHQDYYANKIQIDREFSVYLRRGGIAEQFELAEPFLTNYQTGLIQKIVLDDIVKRYAIDNVNVLREVFAFVSGNITSTLSLRKIAARLTDQGIGVTPNTIDNYLNYWQTTYALDKTTKFDYRLSRVFDRTAKYYCVDNFLIRGGRENDEKRLENLVYVELTRRFGRENIYFGQNSNGYEIDFVVKAESEFSYFQVCLTLNDQNARREFGNLNLVSKQASGAKTLLYLDDQRLDKKDSGCTPVIKWLLN